MFYKYKYHQTLFDDGVLVQIFSKRTEFWGLLVISVTKRGFLKSPIIIMRIYALFSDFSTALLVLKFHF